jgi:hypothetical protein
MGVGPERHFRSAVSASPAPSVPRSLHVICNEDRKYIVSSNAYLTVVKPASSVFLA